LDSLRCFHSDQTKDGWNEREKSGRLGWMERQQLIVMYGSVVRLNRHRARAETVSGRRAAAAVHDLICLPFVLQTGSVGRQL